MYELIVAAGLADLWREVLQNWIGPLFFAGIAIFGFHFLQKRQWTALISFVGIAAVVGVLIYAAPTLFGEQGKLKKVAEDAATKVNVVNIR